MRGSGIGLFGRGGGSARMLLWLLCSWLLTARPAEGLNPPGLSFYEYETPANCSMQVPWSYSTPLLAGKLGFWGTTGDGIYGSFARLGLPRALALDEIKPRFHDSGKVTREAKQRRVYVSDAANHAVRVIDLATGTISTVAGALNLPGAAGDGGPALAARLRDPWGLALDSLARRLYLADSGNHAVRCLDLTSGTISTVAGRLGQAGSASDDGGAAGAGLRHPAGLALDSAAGRLYVADAGNGVVRSLNLSTGALEVLDAQPALSRPVALALDLAAQRLYVADEASHVVWRLALSGSGTAEVVLGTPGVAGDRGNAATTFNGFEGNASGGLLKNPSGLALDPIGQRLYVADTSNPAVQVVDLATGTLSLAVGRPGYYDHGLSEDDIGPVGLALAEARVPGFRVIYRIHNNYEGKQRYGKYFYFNSSNVPNFQSGVHRVRQYRNDVLIWVGLVQFYNHARNLGPFAQSCGPNCMAQGVRWPEGSEQYNIPGAAAEGQWDLGDIALIPELHGEASQPLYMAEGHNYVVRTADIGSPTTPICTSTGPAP